jgi:Ca2+-binding EF-hand superfamily protein
MCEASAREANQQRLQAKYKRMSERQLSQSYPFFKFFDVDGDGEVTSDEWITSFFHFYDVNQDYRMGL